VQETQSIREGAAMARQAKLDAVENDRVRIPARIYHRLTELLNSLEARIIDGAARVAEKRGSKKYPGEVNDEDILQYARLYFGSAASELEELLRKSKVFHARRNAS
jgi:hypothetical protein